MTNAIRHALMGFALFVLSAAGAGCGRKGEPDRAKPARQGTIEPAPVARRVLLVQSYHAEDPWVAAISKAVGDTLTKGNTSLEIYYMDTKRRTDDAYKRESGQLARKRVEELKPGVVIAADDDAQEYFAKSYVGQPLPVVFCGVRAEPRKYGYPASNVTGIVEQPNLKKAIELLARFRPVKNIAILSDDDPTSGSALNFIKQGNYPATLGPLKTIGDFDTWKQAVKAANLQADTAVVYGYRTVKRKGQTVAIEPKEVMAWTVRNLKIPSLGLFEMAIEDGALMGVAESGEEHGRKAGEYALKILDGAAPGSLPVVTADVGTNMLNKATAAKLRLKLDPAKLSDVKMVGDAAGKPRDKKKP
jgi:ABC-type uncharacterized transport system substrate-binding protein